MEYQAINFLTAPIVEPVTVDEVKEQLRLELDEDTQDTMIESYIAAAREGVEKYLGRALNTQTIQIFFDCFFNLLELPYPPIQSLTHVKYFDSDGVQQTLSTDVYQSDIISIPGRIILKSSQSWPTLETQKLNAVEVQFDTGYGDLATDIPQPIRQLVAAIAVDLYEHPEMNVELRLQENRAYDFLAVNYKIPVVY